MINDGKLIYNYSTDNVLNKIFFCPNFYYRITEAGYNSLHSGPKGPGSEDILFRVLAKSNAELHAHAYSFECHHSVQALLSLYLSWVAYNHSNLG